MKNKLARLKKAEARGFEYQRGMWDKSAWEEEQRA